MTGPILCTKGVAYVRRDHDAGGAAGRAAGRVAGLRAAQALAARAPRHLRRGAADLRARHDARGGVRGGLLLRALHLHVYRPSRSESQLGNNSRYVAGKRRRPQGRLWLAIGFAFSTHKTDRVQGQPFEVVLFYLCCASSNIFIAFLVLLDYFWLNSLAHVKLSMV